MTTSIYERIIQDHTRHRELLDKLSETSGDTDDRQEAWNEFYYDVKSHAAAEEETFYSKLMADTQGQDDARHSVSEHKELDDLIGELHEMEFSSPGWLAKFKTLKHDYEHHMDEEESDIFEKAREVFDREESGEIGKAFLERKRAERELVDEKAEASLEE